MKISCRYYIFFKFQLQLSINTQEAVLDRVPPTTNDRIRLKVEQF